MNKLKVHSLESFGTQDGPGIRLVVFLQGCNFRCLYCQNVDTQPLCSKAEIEMSVDDVLKLLEKQKPYFKNGGGLTVSGGEPTLQAAALVELFEACRDHGFNTALDTNGGVFSPTVNKLYDLTDLVILDVKHIDEEVHQKLIGASRKNVLKNAEYREKSGKPMILRYVLVPTWNDQDEYLHRWGETFKNYKTVTQVELLPYHTLGVYKFEELGMDYQLKDINPPTPENVENARKILSQYFSKVVVK